MKTPCKICGEGMEWDKTMYIQFDILRHGWEKHNDKESKYLLDKFNEVRKQ